MPSLDFKEISSASAAVAQGQQDSFELFAREVLEMIGFRILTNVNRGADQGKDIIVEESRRGVGGESKIRWLVSCKHNAHNGKSVTPEQEANILDRVTSHKCAGFLGFYSTVPSSGLEHFLQNLGIESQVYDNERIERSLIGSAEGATIARRFFPISMARWENDVNRPAELMIKTLPLLCEHTQQNLLDPTPRGIVVFCYDGEARTTCRDIYWCLKGAPDDILERKARSKGYFTGWEDISDVVIPTIFLKWILTLCNELRGEYIYSDEAYAKLQKFLWSIFPHVARSLTEEEKSRVSMLITIPSWVGGLG